MSTCNGFDLENTRSSTNYAQNPPSTQKLYVKSQRGMKPWSFNRGLLSIKSSLARCTLEPILKVGGGGGGGAFGTSSFHLSNFERILRSKIGLAHGTHPLKSQIDLCKAHLGPSILVG